MCYDLWYTKFTIFRGGRDPVERLQKHSGVDAFALTVGLGRVGFLLLGTGCSSQVRRRFHDLTRSLFPLPALLSTSHELGFVPSSSCDSRASNRAKISMDISWQWWRKSFAYYSHCHVRVVVVGHITRSLRVRHGWFCTHVYNHSRFFTVLL